MLWVLKRAVSLRQFFWAPKTNVKIDAKENVHNFTLKIYFWTDEQAMDRYSNSVPES